jgi:iron complex transport system permease protein
MKTKRNLYALWLLLGVGVLSLLLCPFIGLQRITLEALRSDESLRYVFMHIRLPRTLAAFVAGGGLGVAGLVYQALFRNPLASPYTLGVSGGASLGAALCIALGAGGSVAGLSFVSLGAFGGALGALVLVYGLAWSRESNSTSILLAGVVVATVCSGFIMFVHYISPLRHAFQIMQWTMGGVDGVGWVSLGVMAVPVVLYLVSSGVYLPLLDQFVTGDALAHARGVPVRAARNGFLVVTAVAVGAIVAVVGPIGFVGIMAPHVCRMVLGGARHRMLGLCSFMVGGTFLVLSDTLARTIMPPAEIPVGIITALVGGPFFLGILIRQRGRISM